MSKRSAERASHSKGEVISPVGYCLAVNWDLRIFFSLPSVREINRSVFFLMTSEKYGCKNKVNEASAQNSVRVALMAPRVNSVQRNEPAGGLKLIHAIACI
jgi:hypothetical protein